MVILKIMHIHWLRGGFKKGAENSSQIISDESLQGHELESWSILSVQLFSKLLHGYSIYFMRKNAQNKGEGMTMNVWVLNHIIFIYFKV